MGFFYLSFFLQNSIIFPIYIHIQHKSFLVRNEMLVQNRSQCLCAGVCWKDIEGKRIEKKERKKERKKEKDMPNYDRLWTRFISMYCHSIIDRTLLARQSLIKDQMCDIIFIIINNIGWNNRMIVSFIHQKRSKPIYHTIIV